MLNRAVEMHDSVLASVSITPVNADLHFSKIYIHQSEGAVGKDRGSVWVQEALIRISTPLIAGEFASFPTTLANGRLIAGKTAFSNVFPLPLRYEGSMELTLEPMWEPNTSVRFRGAGIELQLLGEAKYIEGFPGE